MIKENTLSPDPRAEAAKGFTLVELAIALMVIGLLIGGVLKGQELVENARIIRTVKDLQDYDTAVMMFRNTYNALPGDFRNAASRLDNCGPPYCDLVSTGAGNGWIDTSTEVLLVWFHLERAGLISGINEQEDRYMASPKNAFGGYFTFGRETAMANDPPTETYPHLHYYTIGDLSGGGPSSNRLRDCTRIRRVDEKMDDGKPLSGKVLTYVNHAASTQCRDTDTGAYTNARTRTYILVESASAN